MNSDTMKAVYQNMNEKFITDSQAMELRYEEKLNERLIIEEQKTRQEMWQKIKVNIFLQRT